MPKSKLNIFSLIVFILPFAFSIYFYTKQSNLFPLLIYIVMSIITFIAYVMDKKSAIEHRWRIAEVKLHLFELLGGWPGALIAQNIIRHKNKKLSYQFVFWLIVLLHMAPWIDYVFFGGKYIIGRVL
jgi:uncharacterized membrane protein YsdA (DUF1294 family)